MMKKKLPLSLSFLVIMIISLVSWQIIRFIKSGIEREIQQSTETVLNTTHQGIKSWIDENKAAVGLMANSPEIRQATKKLLKLPHTNDALINSSAQQFLREWFSKIQYWAGYKGVF